MISRSFLNVDLHINSYTPGAAVSFLEVVSKCAEWEKFDYYFFCDQDDVWHPNKLLFVENTIRRQRRPIDLICHDVELIDHNGISLNKEFYNAKTLYIKPDTLDPGVFFINPCS